MGEFELGKFAGRFVTPSVGMLGAGIVALLILLPSPVEARFLNRSLEVNKECSNPLSDHLSFRAAGPCKREITVATESPEPEHKIFSGKFSAGLVDELYCRTMNLDLAQLTKKSTANIPYPMPQRMIATQAHDADEWPPGNFSPGPDRRMIEASWRERIPDG